MRMRMTVAALAALALLAAGCGSGAAGAGTDANGRPKLTVLASPVGFEAVYLAKQQGYFDAQKLDVTIKPGGTADAQIPQLLNGQAQLGMTGGVAMVNAASKKLPVSITLGALNATPPITSGLVVPEKSPIRTTGDLAGKKVGVGGLKDTTQLGTMMSAEAHGADPKSITFVETPLPTMAQAMAKGTIAAAYVIGPFFRIGKGTGYRLLEASATEYLKNGPNVVFAAANNYIAKNKDVLRRFNAAMTKGVAYANAHSAAVRAIDGQYTKQPPAYIKSHPLSPLVTKINKSTLQVTADAMAKYGFISNRPDVGSVVSDVCPVG